MSVYQIVTERIISLLEKGTIPWRKPFTGVPLVATSLSTGKPYRGINHWMLDPTIWGYSSPYWGTMKQVNLRGGTVKTGEQSRIACFWAFIEDKKNPNKKIPLLRYYRVFNLDQTEGISLPTPEQSEFLPIEAAQKIVDGYQNPPKILHNGGDRCFYSVDRDTISMAERTSFGQADEYYGVLFHEMAHSTGHQSRLNRPLSGYLSDSTGYAKEELIAEMTSAMLCATAGISTPKLEENTAAYVKSWIGRLSDDPKLVVTAAGAAQKAADYILGTNSEKPEETEE